MADRMLAIPAELDDSALVAYLNERIEDIKPACDLDVSWAYIRAVVDDVRVIAVSRGSDEVHIVYRYDYTAHCACKNLDAQDSLTGHLTCMFRNGQLLLSEHVPPERSTFEEF